MSAYPLKADMRRAHSNSPLSARSGHAGGYRSAQRNETRSTAEGGYALEGALAPIEIDLDNQSGTYEEPNVWVWYDA
jgi:hypothetical protein